MFVDVIGSVTVENGVARLIFYVDQRDAYGLEREQQVALRVIAPAAALAEIARLMQSVTAIVTPAWLTDHRQRHAAPSTGAPT